MKILTKKNTVIAQAETMAEAILLFNLAKHPERGYETAVASATPRRNSWKGKHRQVCPKCGKKYRNLKLHVYKKHDHPDQ